MIKMQLCQRIRVSSCVDAVVQYFSKFADRQTERERERERADLFDKLFAGNLRLESTLKQLSFY